MAGYYPIYLSLKNTLCIVIGGGGVAERKVRSLLKNGARVTVISPELTAGLSALVKKGEITHIKDRFKRKYVKQARLVIGATSDNEVNREIYEDSQKKGILVNIVDSPKYCDFIVPSVVERKDLVIAISTSGKSPALAKKIRKEIEAAYGEEYAEFLSLMGRIRKRVISRIRDQKKREKIFDNLVHSDIIDLIKNREEDKVKSLIDDFIKKIDNLEI